MAVDPIALILRGLGTAALVALGIWFSAEILKFLVVEAGDALSLTLGSCVLAAGLLLLSLRHGRRSFLAGV
jgi:hypothetical protein